MPSRIQWSCSVVSVTTAVSRRGHLNRSSVSFFRTITNPDRALAGYTFEIASYRILIATAEYIGDTDTVAACKRILAEELAMAKWLEDNVGSVTQEFLRRDEGDLDAKR